MVYIAYQSENGLVVFLHIFTLGQQLLPREQQSCSHLFTLYDKVIMAWQGRPPRHLPPPHHYYFFLFFFFFQPYTIVCTFSSNFLHDPTTLPFESRSASSYHWISSYFHDLAPIISDEYGDILLFKQQ